MGRELYETMKEQIRIDEYAARRFGFTIVRKGKYFSLKEHDSVIIDPVKNCFWRNSVPGNGKAIGHGGSIIDFVLEFSGMSLHEVLKELSTEVYGNAAELPRFNKPVEKKEKAQRLVLPPKGKNMKRVFAYLIKSRGISKDVVQLLVDRRQLYQDEHGNCVFVGYDRENPSKAVFVSIRGTNTEKSFYKDLETNDYEQCWYLNNGIGRLYVTESVIDAASKMTLLGVGMKNFDYLSLSGVGKCACLRTYITDPKLTEIWIGTDNDAAGKEAAELICSMAYQIRPEIEVVTDIPQKAKDWNEYLRTKNFGIDQDEQNGQ